MRKIIIVFAVTIIFVSCKKDVTENISITKELTIFTVNDVHGQLINFSKVKHIVDKEKEEKNVILVCAGDIFSGNPIVDIYTHKGYPMINIMNEIGFDVFAIGNHEFDYGESILRDRMNQSNFPWICANIDMGSTGIPEPLEYKTFIIDDLRITFLGLIETNGKPDAVIPSTHPWKVQNLIFEKPEEVVSHYANLKDQENSDLYIALSHLGIYENIDLFDDVKLATQFPYFDLIIGGHTNQLLDMVVNNTPLFITGKYLNYLRKINIKIKNKTIESINSELIDLNAYQEYDTELKALIDDYDNSMPFINEVIGYSHLNHQTYQIGCFYTDALREYMNVEVSFQNTGGIRSGIDEGDITVREIYEIDPFSNGTIIYNMSVAEIKNYLTGASFGNYYSGIQIEQVGADIVIKDLNGDIIPDDTVLSVGINDYIPAVNTGYFPINGNTQTLTTAETLIAYLQTINNQVNYPICDCYFKYE